MKIVFMGTSEFSLKALEAIFNFSKIDENFEIVFEALCFERYDI